MGLSSASSSAFSFRLYVSMMPSIIWLNLMRTYIIFLRGLLSSYSRVASCHSNWYFFLHFLTRRFFYSRSLMCVRMCNIRAALTLFFRWALNSSPLVCFTRRSIFELMSGNKYVTWNSGVIWPEVYTPPCEIIARGYIVYLCPVSLGDFCYAS